MHADVLAIAPQGGSQDPCAADEIILNTGYDHLNGIGIPEADRERLFRRFERGSNTGGISGTGLGLHIVKEIVHGHGGTVSFESEVDKGTTFWLNLPKVPIRAEHSPFTETAARADL